MTTAIDHRKNLTVVGVDGSVSARNAVRWAATDVVGRDTTLLLVYATYPTGDICSEVAALRIPDRQLCTSILLSVYGPSSNVADQFVGAHVRGVNCRLLLRLWREPSDQL